MAVHFNAAGSFAIRQLGANNSSLNKALERLSSGYRINRASDDAAGLAVSEKLRAQTRGLGVALRNIQDGISMIQTAEGGMSELSNMLQRMRELMIQAGNGILNNSDRSLIQIEVDQLLNEVNRMSTSVQFNNRNLLDGTFSTATLTSGATGAGGNVRVGSIQFQVGANNGNTLSAGIATMTSQALGLNTLFSSSAAVTGTGFSTGTATQALTATAAQARIATLDSALNTLARNRATLGALENRMESTMNFTALQRENLAAAESRLRDTDMASEIIDFTKSQILVQTATAMLSQANLSSQSILQLL